MSFAKPNLEIKQQYDFAMSSLSRMYGVKHVQSNANLHRFCVLWAESGLCTPDGTLTQIDFYFRDLLLS